MAERTPEKPEPLPPELRDLNPIPDATGGRGYADDDRPTRLSRIGEKLQIRIRREIQIMDRWGDENQGYDQVVTTEEEELEILATKSTSEWEDMVRTLGAERTAAMRRRLQELMLKNPEGLPGV
jgi:hypothetical protein